MRRTSAFTIDYMSYSQRFYSMVLGMVFAAASETCFLLLLLLLAKGYTITRGRLPVAASIKITIFMCLYVVTYLSLFIYETNVSGYVEIKHMLSPLLHDYSIQFRGKCLEEQFKIPTVRFFNIFAKLYQF